MAGSLILNGVETLALGSVRGGGDFVVVRRRDGTLAKMSLGTIRKLAHPDVKVTWSVQPSQATLTVNGVEYSPYDGVVEVTLEWGSTVNWECSCEGYITMTGSFVVRDGMSMIHAELEADPYAVVRLTDLLVFPHYANDVGPEQIVAVGGHLFWVSIWDVVRTDGTYVSFESERDGLSVELPPMTIIGSQNYYIGFWEANDTDSDIYFTLTLQFEFYDNQSELTVVREASIPCRQNCEETDNEEGL